MLVRSRQRRCAVFYFEGIRAAHEYCQPDAEPVGQRQQHVNGRGEPADFDRVKMLALDARRGGEHVRAHALFLPRPPDRQPEGDQLPVALSHPPSPSGRRAGEGNVCALYSSASATCASWQTVMSKASARSHTLAHVGLRLRRGRDDLRTPPPFWTGFLSISWSRSVGKPGGGQQRRSAMQEASSRELHLVSWVRERFQARSAGADGIWIAVHKDEVPSELCRDRAQCAGTRKEVEAPAIALA